MKNKIKEEILKALEEVIDNAPQKMVLVDLDIKRRFIDIEYLFKCFEQRGGE